MDNLQRKGTRRQNERIVVNYLDKQRESLEVEPWVNNVSELVDFGGYKFESGPWNSISHSDA